MTGKKEKEKTKNLQGPWTFDLASDHCPKVFKKVWQERSNFLSNSYEKIHFLRDFLFEVERFLLLVDRRDTCVFFFSLYTSTLLFFLSFSVSREMQRTHQSPRYLPPTLRVPSSENGATSSKLLHLLHHHRYHHLPPPSSSSPLSPPSPHPPPRFLLPLC